MDAVGSEVGVRGGARGSGGRPVDPRGLSPWKRGVSLPSSGLNAVRGTLRSSEIRQCKRDGEYSKEYLYACDVDSAELFVAACGRTRRRCVTFTYDRGGRDRRAGAFQARSPMMAHQMMRAGARALCLTTISLALPATQRRARRSRVSRVTGITSQRTLPRFENRDAQSDGRTGSLGIRRLSVLVR